MFLSIIFFRTQMYITLYLKLFVFEVTLGSKVSCLASNATKALTVVSKEVLCCDNIVMFNIVRLIIVY